MASRFAVVGQGPEVRIWDLTTGRERATLVGHADTVKAVACSVLDGRPIAVTGGDDRIVPGWGPYRQEGHRHPLLALPGGSGRRRPGPEPPGRVMAGSDRVRTQPP